ncbi:Glucokinase [Fructilactobacillus florum 8D]|uniref:Glucokinase n=2 Tax=Fructilactobacillus florum TaxID=640331 RepID=W9EDG6_9LACO|nr:ROK family glucokinase [Fructilactobacillus florum]EKK20707.1 Glucokinase [Fructilactobacillus florum 2F]ETO40173.1 Glucokinase [Fructilactobacillus florum 8D]KRM91809.1 glucokinase [Fructilactobacillus florum DSM 22689 = JCM 16035]
MSKKLIGIDLGGTTTKMAFLDENGEVLDKWRILTDISDEGSHIMPNVIASIRKHIEDAGRTPDDFIGIGMGTPGAVDRNNGSVSEAFNLNWRTSQPIRQEIQDELGLPFAVDNDANVAALGEYWKGAGSAEEDVVFVTLGTGVGGGVIANGKLLHGVNGGAGEVGHIAVQPDGYQCTCGKRGCLETYASATGVVRLAADMAQSFHGTSRLAELEQTDEKITSKLVFYLADNGDILANQVVDRVCFYLGLALSSIGNTLNPASIIIGGGVSSAGNTLLQPTTKYFQDNAFPSIRNSTKLRLAELGNDAGVIGAASMALQFR